VVGYHVPRSLIVVEVEPGKRIDVPLSDLKPRKDHRSRKRRR